MAVVDVVRAACAHARVRLHVDGGRAWWGCDDCPTLFAPVTAPVPMSIDASPPPEYLSVQQLAERIPYKESAIRQLMTRGVFKLGVHYTKPSGRTGRTVFVWSAVQAWLAAGRPGA